MRKVVVALLAVAFVASVSSVASACPFGMPKPKETKETVSS